MSHGSQPGLKHYIIKDDFELLVLLSQPLDCCNDRHVPQHLFYKFFIARNVDYVICIFNFLGVNFCLLKDFWAKVVYERKCKERD